MSKIVQDRANSIRQMAEPFDIAGQSVIATLEDGTIVYWSAGAAALYGWSANEAMGRNIVDVTPSPAMREEAVEIMTRLTQGQTWSGRFPVRRRNGTEFVAEVRDVPVLDGNGVLIGIVGISKAA